MARPDNFWGKAFRAGAIFGTLSTLGAGCINPSGAEVAEAVKPSRTPIAGSPRPADTNTPTVVIRAATATETKRPPTIVPATATATRTARPTVTETPVPRVEVGKNWILNTTPEAVGGKIDSPSWVRGLENKIAGGVQLTEDEQVALGVLKISRAYEATGEQQNELGVSGVVTPTEGIVMRVEPAGDVILGMGIGKNERVVTIGQTAQESAGRRWVPALSTTAGMERFGFVAEDMVRWNGDLANLAPDVIKAIVGTIKAGGGEVERRKAEVKKIFDGQIGVVLLEGADYGGLVELHPNAAGNVQTKLFASLAKSPAAKGTLGDTPEKVQARLVELNGVIPGDLKIIPEHAPGLFHDRVVCVAPNKPIDLTRPVELAVIDAQEYARQIGGVTKPDDWMRRGAFWDGNEPGGSGNEVSVKEGGALKIAVIAGELGSSYPAGRKHEMLSDAFLMVLDTMGRCTGEPDKDLTAYTASFLPYNSIAKLEKAYRDYPVLTAK